MTRNLFLALTLFLAPRLLSGQSLTLEEETARLKTLLEKPAALEATEREEALSDLAQLYQLSGDAEKAAALLADALRADALRGGLSVEGKALGDCVRLLIALGDFDSAGELALEAQKACKDDGLLREYRFLGALAGAFKTCDIRDLAMMCADPAYRDYRGEIYFSLWKISGEERWRAALLSELPASPEGRIAAVVGGADGGGLAPSPHWLLFPGREGFTLSAPEPPLPAPQSAAPPQSSAPGGTAALQTGLYGSEANAKVFAEKLKKAGFNPDVKPRKTTGGDFWVVTVPPGASMNETIIKLKALGVEAFPVF